MLQTYQIEGKSVRLGKGPAKLDPRTLQLTSYMKAGAPPSPPSKEDYAKAVAKWPVMLNDKLGDCTCAAAGHMIEQWTTYSKKAFTPTDQDILTAYEAVSGYDPTTGQNDDGALMLDVLNYWRGTGVGNHKIDAFVAVDPSNRTDVMDAIYLFGNCYIGVQLPVTAQTQRVWAVPTGGPTGPGAPGSWGGHAIPIVAYDHRNLTVVTWGTLKRMTWGFLQTYCDEAYAVLSMDWFNGQGVAPGDFDFATLQSDLNQIQKARVAASHA